MKTFAITLSSLFILFISLNGFPLQSKSTPDNSIQNALVDTDSTSFCTSKEMELNISSTEFIIIVEEIVDRMQQSSLDCFGDSDNNKTIKHSLQHLIDKELQKNTDLQKEIALNVAASRKKKAITNTELNSQATCRNIVFEASFGEGYSLSVCLSDSICITRHTLVGSIANSPNKQCFNYDLSNTDEKNANEQILINDILIAIGTQTFLFNQTYDCYFLFIENGQICIVPSSAS